MYTCTYSFQRTTVPIQDLEFEFKNEEDIFVKSHFLVLIFDFHEKWITIIDSVWIDGT